MTNVYVIDQVCAKDIFHVFQALWGGGIMSLFSHPYDYLYEIAFILEGKDMQQLTTENAQIGSVGECMLLRNTHTTRNQKF